MATAICLPGSYPNGVLIPLFKWRQPIQELSFPIFCKDGSIYSRVDSPKSSLQVQNYMTIKGVIRHTWKTEGIIKEIKTGCVTLIDKEEFDRVFNSVVTSLA